MIINRFESSGGGGEIIIDVTPITGGAVGRVLFEGAGNVVSENALLSYDVATTTLYSYKGLIGESDGTPYPNAQFISSQTTAGDTHTYNMGVVGEATADGVDNTIWGVGVYGGASTNAGTRSAGVLGDGRVTNTADTAAAVGVRGYADNVHAGGLNIGLYGDAENSSVGNYALWMNAGNIYSQVAQTWTLANSETALDVDSGTFVIDAKNNRIGIGSTGPQARLDVRASGALVSDVALRIRNSANTYDILACYGTELTIIGRNESTEPRLLINRTGSTRMLLGGTTDLNITFPSTGKGEINSGSQGLDIISSSGEIKTRNSSTYTLLAGNYFGIGRTPSARLDVQAAGALSTDLAFRVRNSADTKNLYDIKGTGEFTYLNNSNNNYLFWDAAGIFQIGTSYSHGCSLSTTAGVSSVSTTSTRMAIASATNSLDMFKNGNFQFEWGSGLTQTSGKGAISLKNAEVIPSSNTGDRFMFYGADIVAGNAAPHFRTENGSIIKLYKQDLPTVPTPVEIATFLSNLGLANLV